MIEMNYGEFIKKVFRNETVFDISYTYEKDIDNVRYYEIYASDSCSSLVYFVKINTNTNALFVVDFEDRYKQICDTHTINFDKRVALKTLNVLEDILHQLKFLNTNISVLVESDIEIDDILEKK
jgi:hypothetical protein